jgi:nitrate/TMAO reductase-like tetraheme cytochrome c subunit
MFQRIKRLLIALTIALTFAGVTLLIAQAKDQPNNAVAQATSENCGVCHADVMQAWQNSLHGQAATDQAFTDEWAQQGKPGACLVCHATGYDPATGSWEQDGVACVACHNPVPADHPNEPAPVDKSSDLCATCHSGNRFSWEDWKVSAHYQRNMTCIVCHDPHTASIKTIPNISGQQSESEAASQLCINCHKEYAMDFSYSVHHQQGLNCVDCHLRPLDTSAPAAHAIPDHSFVANVSTCNQCHQDQMHGPTQSSEATAPAQVNPTNQMQLASVTPEPKPVSPLGFAGLAALLGLAVGMVLAPWLERLYQRMNKHHEEGGDE